MKTIIRTLAFLLVATVLLGAAPSINAAEQEEILPRASYYFNNYSPELTPLASGCIHVSFSVSATHAMTKLGATSAVLYEKLPDAFGYTSVAAYNLDTAPSVMAYGKTTHYFGTTYTRAVTGAKYYLSVAFYAEDSNGSEAKYSSSPVFTYQ